MVAMVIVKMNVMLCSYQRRHSCYQQWIYVYIDKDETKHMHTLTHTHMHILPSHTLTMSSDSASLYPPSRHELQTQQGLVWIQYL